MYFITPSRIVHCGEVLCSEKCTEGNIAHSAVQWKVLSSAEGNITHSAVRPKETLIIPTVVWSVYFDVARRIAVVAAQSVGSSTKSAAI